VTVHTLLHQAGCYMGSCLPAWQRVDDSLLSLLTDSMCDKYKQKECTHFFLVHVAFGRLYLLTELLCRYSIQKLEATIQTGCSTPLPNAQHHFFWSSRSRVTAGTAGHECRLAGCPAGGIPSTQAKHAMLYGTQAWPLYQPCVYPDTGPHGLRTCQISFSNPFSICHVRVEALPAQGCNTHMQTPATHMRFAPAL